MLFRSEKFSLNDSVNLENAIINLLELDPYLDETSDDLRLSNVSDIKQSSIENTTPIYMIEITYEVDYSQKVPFDISSTSITDFEKFDTQVVGNLEIEEDNL